MERDIWRDLPDFPRQSIYSKLNFYDKFCFASVCKNWRETKYPFGTRPSHPDWNYLSQSLLRGIFSKLSFRYKTVFSQVCQSWRAASFSTSTTPILDEKEIFTVMRGLSLGKLDYCFWEGLVVGEPELSFRTYFPELIGHRVMATMNGWWLAIPTSEIKPVLDFQVLLFNPCTRLSILLPRFCANFSEPVEVENLFYTMTAPFSANNCSVLAVVLRNDNTSKTLSISSAIWKKNDLRWRWTHHFEGINAELPKTRGINFSRGEKPLFLSSFVEFKDFTIFFSPGVDSLDFGVVASKVNHDDPDYTQKKCEVRYPSRFLDWNRNYSWLNFPVRSILVWEKAA